MVVYSTLSVYTNFLTPSRLRHHAPTSHRPDTRNYAETFPAPASFQIWRKTIAVLHHTTNQPYTDLSTSPAFFASTPPRCLVFDIPAALQAKVCKRIELRQKWL